MLRAKTVFLAGLITLPISVFAGFVTLSITNNSPIWFHFRYLDCSLAPMSKIEIILHQATDFSLFGIFTAEETPATLEKKVVTKIPGRPPRAAPVVKIITGSSIYHQIEAPFSYRNQTVSITISHDAAAISSSTHFDDDHDLPARGCAGAGGA